MRHLTIIYFVCVLLLTFTSCSYKQDQTLFEQRNTITDNTSQNNIANISNYRIQPQDILQITNIQNSKNIVDLSAGVSTPGSAVFSAPGSASASQANENYQVEDDGTIALTGVGRVQIAGLTRVEARKRIEEIYSKDLKHPLLELKIVNLKVSVFGEVKSPGNIVLKKDRTTLIEILGEAGGLTDKADEKSIKVIRGNQKNPTTEILDLSNIKTLTDPRMVLQNNDIVYVSQNKKAIRNNNIQNFSVVIQPALILFNTALIIFTLVRK